MTHKIPSSHIEKLTSVPPATKITQVSNLQNHIQEILGDTHHTFLQGSYKNDTSISEINDVDIVAIRLRTFSGTHSPAHLRTTPNILWDTIFSEIEQKLKDQKKYIWTVTRGDKCIKVETNTLSADVVPAVQVLENHLVDPIAIFSFKKGLEKVNYPRVHWDNGKNKNQATGGHYKPIVRIFKNWSKNHFADLNIVSSYDLESLVHGSNNTNFSNDHVDSFIKVASQIDTTLDLRRQSVFPIPSVCGSEDILSNWDSTKYNTFHSQLKQSLALARSAYVATDIATAENLWKLAFKIQK